jgi:hypothetical protein
MSGSVNKEGKLSTSLKLARAAWRVMKLDKELLGIGAISALVSAILTVAFLVAMFVIITAANGGHWEFTSEQMQQAPNGWYYLALAAYLFVAYVSANFFSAAISHAAFERFNGNNPTFKSALKAAWSKVRALIVFSAFQATVGTVLNVIADRVPFGGRVAVWLTGAAWSVATLFAIPVIVSTGEKNPLAVVKRSAMTFKDIWGESVFIGLSLGVIGTVITLASAFLLVSVFLAAIMFGSLAIGIVLFCLFVLIVIATQIVMSVLKAIVMTAAYYYATTNQLPAGFDEQLIRAMFRPKKKWLRV